MSNTLAADFQTAFFRQCPGAETMMRLFDSLPQIIFYAKDRASRFVKVNHLVLENHVLSNEAEAICRTDHDFHPPLLAEAYIAEDRRVMSSRVPLPGQVWQVPHRNQLPRWYVSTKTPLFDVRGDVIGLAGAMYRIDQPAELARHFQELLPVVSHIEQHFADPISMTEMAALAGLSSTHFNRRFQQLLRITPTQYLRTTRIEAARRLLSTTSRELADIAAAVGFSDQSHFTKRFRQTTGLTPEAYRRRFVPGA